MPDTRPRNVPMLGARIVGVATALYLLRDGHAVTLLNHDAPGGDCSRGNAGIFAVDYVVPLANAKNVWSVPKMLFNPRGPLCVRWRYLWRLTAWLLRFH